MPSDITTDNTSTTGGNPYEPISEQARTLLRVVDGDTVRVGDTSHRIKNIDTEESVHTDKKRNTPKGAATSKFMKNVIPEDSSLTLETTGKDKYGRDLSKATRNINGVDVDWGLVVMDQDLSDYETRYGTAPDDWHEVYKQYYSKYSPYQYGEVVEPMSQEQWQTMATKEQSFKAAYTKFVETGEQDRTELDITLADLYGNPQELAHYRHYKNQVMRKENAKEGGIAAAYQLAEQDPNFRELYNRAVREGSLPRNAVGLPKDSNNFWDRLGATYEQTSVLTNLRDKFELDRARSIKDVSIPIGDILDGVPLKYESRVRQEYNKNGAQAAYVYKDLMLEDIGNNRVFDNLPIHKQVGYGALAILLDPTSWATGGVAAKGATATIKAASKLPMFAKNPTAQASMQVGTWGMATALESAVYDAPRFAEGDLTYDGTDYLKTIAMGAAFGSTLSGVIIGGGKWLDSRALKQSQVNYTKELNDYLEQPTTTDTPASVLQTEFNNQLSQVEARTVESKQLTDSDKIEMSRIKQDMKVVKDVSESKPVQVSELFDVRSVDRSMFNNVLNLARKQMDPKSDLFNFLKRQAGLNKFAEESNKPELTKAANELNANLVKVVSMFPDGKVPYEYKSVLAELRMGQQKWVTNNALEDILDSPNDIAQLPMLERYVNKLKTMDLWLDGETPQPMSWLELAQYAPSVFDMVQTVDGRVIEINRSLPADHKFLHDIVQLNNQARKSADADFIRLVDELNGMVANRLTQKEMGVLVSQTLKTADKTKWFPKTVKRTPDDVRKELKSMGIEQFTPEYRAARTEQKARMDKIIAGQNPSPKQADNIRKIAADKLEQRVKSGELTKINPEWVTAKKRLEEGQVYLPDEIREVGRQDIIRTEGGQVIDDARSQRMDGIMDSDQTKTGDYELDTRTDVIGTQGDYGFDAGAKSQYDFIDPVGKEADILPRKFNEPVKFHAYDSKDIDHIKYLNDQLKSRIVKKLESKVAKTKAEIAKDNLIMSKVVSNMSNDIDRTIRKAMESEQMDYLFAIIRGSEALAQKQKIDLETKPKVGDGVKPEPKPADAYVGRALTEDDVAAVVHNDTSRTPNEKAGIKAQMKLSQEELLEQKVGEITTHIRDFVQTEKPLFEQAAKSTGILDSIGRKLSVLTKDIATKLQADKNDALSYIGYKVTELGRGFGGNAKRGETGGLIQYKVLTDLKMDFMPSYVKTMHEYAASKGANMLETMNAQQMTGAQNPIVKQFNQEFMWLQEMRRLGKTLPSNVNEKLKHVIKFADDWDKMMGKAHDYLVESKIEGFSAERKVKHYVPRIHKYANYKRMIDKFGEGEVAELLLKSMRSVNPKMTILDASKRANEFLEWVMKQDGTTPVEDLFMPNADTRSMSRMPLDMTIEHKGMRMFDLVNDEVMELGMKYSSRVAGWVGLSDSTNGLLNSNLAIDAYKQVIKEHGDEGTILFDDVINMMFGRPTRNGLAEEVRMFKDITALTRMGGLGSAQLVESGQVLIKSFINMYSDPVIAKRLFQIANSDPNDKTVLAEIQALTRISDDMDQLQRQSVNLEQSENIGMQPWRKISTKLADTVTFGKYKAPASRLLGKVSGFNAIHRYQSRVAQSGFVLNAISHFTRGSSALSPKRLADLGLTTPDGKNTELSNTIKQFVELDSDGLPTKLNFDKWPKNVRDEFTNATIRDYTQNVQKTLVGELPAWYNKPLMALAFQFRQFPIVAQNKQLGRALAMADKEAVVATLLNAATAGLVRVSKAALVMGGIAAVSSREYRFNSDPEHIVRDASKYVAQFGVLADATDFVTKAYTSYDDDGFSADLGDTLLSLAPIWGLMKDYKEVADPTSSNRERIDATFGVVPLGNIMFADMLRAQAQEALAE